MLRLLATVFLCFSLFAFSQVNPGKLDSLSHAIDSSNKVIEHWQDSFTKKQDSIYQAGVQASETVGTARKAGDQEKHRTVQITAIGVAIIAGFVALLWLKKRKKKTNSPPY